MHRKMNVVLRGNGIRQHRLEVQVLIQFHQGQEHQIQRILIELCLVIGKRIHPAQTVRHADINDLLTLCRHGRPRSGAFPVCCGIALRRILSCRVPCSSVICSRIVCIRPVSVTAGTAARHDRYCHDQDQKQT